MSSRWPCRQKVNALDDARMTKARHEGPSARSLLDALDSLANDAPEEGMALGALISRLGDRAFGVPLVLLALPCCIPFLYGVPQIVALPMTALAFQLMMGRASPWLPRKFEGRIIAKADLHRMAAQGHRFFGWTEAIIRPRLTLMSGPIGERVIGVFLTLFCLSILTPLPGTNTVPGFAVAMTAMGLMARDGLVILGGLILGTLWIGALIFGALFLGTTGISALMNALGLSG
jgi:hypothetical protein